MEENGKAVNTEAPEKPKKGRKRRDSVDSNKETAGAAAEKDTVAADTETTENGKDSNVGTDTPPGPEPDAEPEDKAEPERDASGEVVESIGDCYRNYSASQLVAMLGMPDGMKQQVTPDMSVRAINRMRRGEDVKPAALPAGVEAPVPEKEPDIKEPPMENTEGTSAVIPEAEDTEPDIMEEKAAGPEESIMEDTVPEPETDSMGITGAAPEERPGTTEQTEDNRGGAVGTLVEIDSYTGYRSIAGKIDTMIKQVFSASTPVKVKIVCEQG